MTTCVVYVDNTNNIEVRGLKSVNEAEYIDDATVTVTVKDADGVNVVGQTWPATLAFVEGSDGDYRGILEHDLELVAGDEYTAHIDANAGSNRRGHWEYVFKPKTRHGT